MWFSGDPDGLVTAMDVNLIASIRGKDLEFLSGSPDGLAIPTYVYVKPRVRGVDL